MNSVRFLFVIVFVFSLGLSPCWGQTQFFALPGSFGYALNSINEVADVNSAGTIGVALSNPPSGTVPLLTTFIPATGQVLDSKAFGFGPLGVKLAQIPEGLRAVVLTSQGGPRNIFLVGISSTGLITSIAQTPLTTSIADGGSNLVVSPSGKAGFALVYAPTGPGKDIVSFSLVDGSFLGRVHFQPTFSGKDVLALVDTFDGRRLLAFPSQDTEVTVVDATNVAQPVLQGKVTLTLVPPPGVPSNGVAFSPDGRYLYASSSRADLSAIDTQTLSVLGSVGGSFHYGAMVVSEGISGIQIAAYGGIGATPSITLINAADPAHLVAVQHYSPAGLWYKSGFKFSKDGRRLYVTTNTAIVGFDVPSLQESFVIPVSGSRQSQQILAPAFCAPEKVLAVWGIDTYFGSANIAPASTSSRARDLDGDGKSDIVWQYPDGSTSLWLMDGTAMKSSAGLLGPGTGWSVKLRADFDGDAKTDIIWQNADGSTAMWLMNGLTLSSGALLIGPGSGWSVTNVGDFNGDGKKDLIWQHTDGRSTIWLMNGLQLTAGAGLLGPNTGWSVKQVGDFDGDGRSDILWQHTDGSAAVWLMNGVGLSAGAVLLGPGQWSAKLIGDFNGDGKSDVIWLHPDGSTAMWLMNGLAIGAGAVVLGPNTGWAPKDVGDFNADGKTDIIWQHTDGSTAMWLVDGFGILSGTIVRLAGTGYSVNRVGDFDGDGKSDLLWLQTDGSSTIWLMDGLSPATIGNLLGPATGWCPAP